MGDQAAWGLGFSVTIDVPRNLFVDDDRVDALITVKAAAAGAGAPAGRNAEILVMDRSLSMADEDKVYEAQRAACAAIDALPDGALLGIVAGNHFAERHFPSAAGLATVTAETRLAAKRAVMNLRPAGGTKIGQWLAAAGELFAATEAADGAVRHAVLYSDGKNQHETRAELDAVLHACTDQFICDVRGVGDDWDYAELLHIAGSLQGDATAVLRIADLTDDFTRLIQRVRRLVVPRAYLRLTPDPRFEIVSVEQARPVHVSLTDQRQPAANSVVDVPLGSWAEETRLYRMSVRFDPHAVPLDQLVRVTPVELVVETADGTRERRADAPLIIRRHDVPGPETERRDGPTQLEKMAELTVTIQACVDAWLGRRTADADDELDRAIGLAREIRDMRLHLLEDVATFDPGGRARVRRDVSDGEMKRLGLDSRKTGFRPEDEKDEEDEKDKEVQQPVVGRTCPACHELTYAPNPKSCENCGTPFGEQGPS